MNNAAFLSSLGLMLAAAMQTTTASTTFNARESAVAVQSDARDAQLSSSSTRAVPTLNRGFVRTRRKNIGLLYVSNYATSEIEIFRADRSFGLVGVIKNGIRNPEQIAVDRFGTLYVCNIGVNSVTEYARGSTSPKVTLSSGISGPSGIAVGPSGTVYVSNNNSASSVVAFVPGSGTPTTVTQAIQFPLGLALDNDGNLFVGAETAGVYEIPSGSTVPIHLKINVAQFVIGVAIGSSGDLDVSGQANNNRSTEVDGFRPPYTGAPYRTINTGINATPYYLTAPGDFLLVPLQGLNRVDIYRGQSTKPIASIMSGLNEPVGVVFSPGS